MIAIVRKARGEETIVDKGSRAAMNDRLKQLRKSTTRGVSGRSRKHCSILAPKLCRKIRATMRT